MSSKHEEMDSDEEQFIKYKNLRATQLKQNKVPTIPTETHLIQLTKEKTMIVHFYDTKFKRCDQMDNALYLISQKFPYIEFYRIEGSNAPFVSKRLDIRALPTLAFFKDGYYIDTVVGFENVGNERLDLEELNAYIENSVISKEL